MGRPACTVGPGQAIVEVTVIALDRIGTPAGPIDTQAYADTLLRLGLAEETELQLGMTGYVQTLVPDPARPRLRIHAGGIGDSYLALRHTLTNAGPVAAVEGYVTLPTGAPAVSAGTWGAGIVVPMDLATIGGLSVTLVPEIDAVPSASGKGRHLGYGAVLGLSGEVAKDVGAAFEIAAERFDAPEGGEFVSIVAGSFAWQATDDLQFNIEVDVGLLTPEPHTLAMVGFALRL